MIPDPATVKLPFDRVRPWPVLQGMIQILDSTYEEEIRSLELRNLKQTVPNEMDREMLSWNAPWRKESLEHYLATGWSVGLFDSTKKLTGYFLAQPLLFFKGLTQVLWVEHFCFNSTEDYEILKDTVTRYAREKHLQSVMYMDQNGQVAEIKTTKR